MRTDTGLGQWAGPDGIGWLGGAQVSCDVEVTTL